MSATSSTPHSLPQFLEQELSTNPDPGFVCRLWFKVCFVCFSVDAEHRQRSPIPWTSFAIAPRQALTGSSRVAVGTCRCHPCDACVGIGHPIGPGIDGLARSWTHFGKVFCGSIVSPRLEFDPDFGLLGKTADGLSGRIVDSFLATRTDHNLRVEGVGCGRKAKGDCQNLGAICKNRFE